MTVLLPAWLQSGAYTAEHDRFVGTALLNPGTALTGRGGVRRVLGDEFQVTATAPASMSVQVGPGMAFVQGIYTITQGAYTVVNDGMFQLTIGAAHSTLARIDSIVLEVLDVVYAGASNLAQVRVLPGTPASTPVPPTPTGSYIVLAQVLVPVGATSIVSGNITDLRPFTAGLGAPIPVRNVTERNALSNKYDGLSVLMIDNAYELHTYAGGKWYGTNERYYGVSTANTYSGIADDNMRTVVDRAKVPDPGFEYLLRLDFDMETSGARVNANVYCESTTTTGFSNVVAAGQTLTSGSMGNQGWDRMRINRTFAQVYTGNRWVTVRFYREASEADTTVWGASSYQFNCQLRLVPMRPAGFVFATSVGGQP